ncbi:MAG TPA: phosphatase PAP2 family protein [Vicinamibacterales bacterium]|jgi:undecaprenyl-diphosphatase|nr:phosphatase PAP2 family protein [Vicinamibacterales bacterium]
MTGVGVLVGWWKGATGWLTKLERRELGWLLVGLGACILLWGFLALAGEVMEGETLAFDRKIVLAFRKANDPSQPIGPAWITDVLLDLTALGGPTVLGLVVVSIIGFLLLQARYRTAFFIFLTAATGEAIGAAMKSLFERARPTVVPHLREAFSSSFPSGHAMQSAIIYLTLGAMLMRISERRLTKLYCCAMAMMLTVLVGVSRVYLGVHYPTDVLAGWTVGLFWASLCWLAEQHFEVSAGIREERKQG